MSHKAVYTVATAGAGTGKTYALVENYLFALLGLDESAVKKRPHEILALTFTEKAANEMRIRITNSVSELLSDNETSVKRQLRDRFGDLPEHSEIQKILRALPSGVIATFHGFCAQLLRNEGRVLGINDRFSILAPKDELQLARNILRPIVIEKVQAKGAMRSLAARFRLGNGPMSLGLIDGLLELYFKLFEKGLTPNLLHAISEKNGIAKSEIESHALKIEVSLDRFRAAKISKTTESKLSRINDAFCNLEEHLLSDNEQKIAHYFGELRSAASGNFGDKTNRADLVSKVVRLGARLVDYFVAPDELACSQVLVLFHEAFERFKMANSLLSYGDLLKKTRDALCENETLRRKIKQRYSHILVDEYQDTSPIQEDIIVMLSENKAQERQIKTSASVLHEVELAFGSSLFIVGDKKQSIYGFRGADTKLFDRMVQKMSESKSDTGLLKRLLTINRRSHKKIIALVNLVASHTLSQQGYQEEHALKATDDAKEGKCALWIKEDDFDFDKTESNLICAAHGIFELLSDREDLKPKDIVVLVRRIRASYPLKEELAKFGIPSRIVGGEGFFQQQEIVDLLSALKLINDPKDSLASAVVLRSPLVLLTDHEIMKCAIIDNQGPSLLAANKLLLSGELKESSKNRLSAFLSALKDTATTIAQHGLSKSLDLLMERCDFAYAIGLSEHAQRKWANIQKLRTLLSKPENPFLLIDEMYQQIFLDTKEPLAEGTAAQDAVTIMTIHQAKGLEWKVVILADSESQPPHNYGDFLTHPSLGLSIKPRNRPIASCAPSSNLEKTHDATRYLKQKEIIKVAEQEEMARLLYVALTRAREELYVACSKASFLKSDHTLVGLFLEAFRQSKDRFLAACDLKIIGTKTGRLSSPLEEPAPKKITIFNSAHKAVRLFASQLEVPDQSEILSLVKKEIVYNHSLIDGDLAHKLLAFVGNAANLESLTENGISQLINAGLRALAIAPDDKVESTMDAVRETLGILGSSIKTSAHTIFEMAICCHPSPEVLIEGFADLVIEADDFVGVIEFKSSINKAIDPNSYFQVLAYAHALSYQFDKPIKYAVVKVGARQNVKWQDYDHRTEEIFLCAVDDYTARFFTRQAFALPRADSALQEEAH